MLIAPYRQAIYIIDGFLYYLKKGGVVMKQLYLISIVAIFVLSGFTSISEQMKNQLETLPQHYSQFDVKMAWAVKALNGKTAIDGVIQNIRYATMEDLEISVSTLDSAGKATGHSTSFVIPIKLNKDDLAPFAVVLPVAYSAGTKLMFTYKYLGNDGDGDGGGVGRWMQSFESIVP